jgi:hypothetical protein
MRIMMLPWAALILIVAGTGWGLSWNSQRLFMNEYSAGVHFYLTGDRAAARGKLAAALQRKPQHVEARRLLIKILVDEGVDSYIRKDPGAAGRFLSEALKWAPPGPEQHALLELQRRVSFSSGHSGGPDDRWLQTLSEKRLASAGSVTEDLIREWLSQSRADRAEFFRTLALHQDQWLDQMGKERSAFRSVLFSGGIFIGLLGLAMAGFLVRFFYMYRAYVQQAPMTWSLPAGSAPRMELLPSGTEWRKIDAIEAELVNESDSIIAQTLLKPYLRGEDPWVRARAAKALYKLDPDVALSELKSLVENKSSLVQLPGVWALGELGTAEGIGLLAPLLSSSNKEIQQTVIRCLVQMENKKQLSPEVLSKVQKLLADVRQKTEWII